MKTLQGKRQTSGRDMTGHHIAALAPGPADTAFASGEIEMRNCLGKDSLFPFGIEPTMRGGSVYLPGIMKRDKYITWVQELIS